MLTKANSVGTALVLVLACALSQTAHAGLVSAMEETKPHSSIRPSSTRQALLRGAYADVIARTSNAKTASGPDMRASGITAQLKAGAALEIDSSLQRRLLADPSDPRNFGLSPSAKHAPKTNAGQALGRSSKPLPTLRNRLKRLFAQSTNASGEVGRSGATSGAAPRRSRLDPLTMSIAPALRIKPSTFTTSGSRKPGDSASANPLLASPTDSWSQQSASGPGGGVGSSRMDLARGLGSLIDTGARGGTQSGQRSSKGDWKFDRADADGSASTTLLVQNILAAIGNSPWTYATLALIFVMRLFIGDRRGRG
jgi:hypothetical protein